MTLSAGRIGATRILGLVVFAVAVCIALLGNIGQVQAGAPAGAPAVAKSKVEQRVLSDTANGASTQFLVLLTQQADVSKAYTMQNQDARGWYVYSTLRDFADKSQAPIRKWLSDRGVSYQPYWAANVILVTGNRAIVDGLAAMPDVKQIESNAPFKGISDPVGIQTALITSSTSQPDTIEWGVQRVNAPQVWAMGFTGQGIVIGNQDTGMRWTHNAIKPHYRGWNGTTADHNYNWHDAIHDSTGNPCGNDSQQPCDDHGHGTHTTGTTSGDDGAGNQIGVAPGAKWIGCRNMDQGTGTPARYTECFQFFIAPTDLQGNNPDPTKRPHVMNNSWGCPTSEGCAPTTLQTIVENTQAAGIFVEVSAGNSGSSCSTVTDPPAIYGASFSTGALDINNGLAGFSSRGPVTVDGSNRRKPDISGPGVNVRSSVNSSDTSYANFSGTSMAGPHVVGVVALLWSAHPELSRMITETKTLLENTASQQVSIPAQTCGGIPSTTFPNNQVGYGRVDALAAVGGAGTATPTATATSTGVVSTATATATSTGVVSTSTPTSTHTSVPTITSTPGSPTATPTECTINFTDVHTTDYFYNDVRCVYCLGAVSGYSDGTFRPFNNTTRGQMTKIIVIALRIPISTPTGTPTFRDVAANSPFYPWIETSAEHSIVSGYNCGGVGEPCPGLYFRPNANVTRGQLSKIVVVAANQVFGWSIVNPATPTFTDVAPGSAFYTYIETAVCHGVISGYADHTFRPGNNAIRAQIAKIVCITSQNPASTCPTPPTATAVK